MGLVVATSILTTNVSESKESLYFQIRRIEVNQFIQKGSLDTAIQILNQICSVYLLEQNYNQFYFDKLQISELYSKLGNFEQSRIEAYSCLMTAKSIEDTIGQLYCEILYEIASLKIEWGQLEESKKYLLQAKSILNSTFSNHDSLLFLIEYKLGTYYFFKNSFDSSLMYYEKSYELIDYLSNNEEAKYKCLQSIGIINTLQGNYTLAEENLLNSSKIADQVFANDIDKQTYTHLNLGKFYDHIGQHKRSLYHLNKVENILSRLINPNIHVLFRLYWNKGIAFLHIEESSRAIYYLEKALDLSEEYYKDNYTFLYPLYMDLAYCYEYFGHYDLAEKYYSLSLNSKDDLTKLKVVKNLASLHNNLGNTTLSLQMYENAIMLVNSLHKIDSLTIAHTFMRFGEFLLNQDNKTGEEYLFMAKEIYEKKIGLHFKDVSIINKALGDYYNLHMNFSVAINFYDHALQSYSIEINNMNDMQSPKINIDGIDPLIIEILLNKSNACKNLFLQLSDDKSIDNAIKGFDFASVCLHTLLTLYSDRQSFIEFNSRYDEMYNQAISACRMAFSVTGDSSYLYKAFDFAERNKSMNLLMSLKEEDAKEVGNIPPALREKERDLKLSRNIYIQALYEERKKENPDRNKIQYWTERLYALESEYATLVDLLEKDYPEYYAMKYNFTTAGVDQVQELLAEDEMCIEYALGPDSVYLFIITSQTFHLEARKADSSLILDIFALRENLKPLDIIDYNKRDFRDFQLRSGRLYDLLIAPFDQMNGIKKLIIVPDDELGYLSFDMLAQCKIPEKEIRFSNLPFLVKEFSISYAPSLTLFHHEKTRSDDQQTRGLLGFAPVYEEPSGLPQQSGADAYEPSPGNLPGAVAEVRNIPGRYYGRKFFGEHATEQNFKLHSGRYDILHLAMHARINDEFPMTSQLEFSPSPDSPEDGMLHTYEIFSLDLACRMVILSACRSGFGRLEKGEGINSLARAFLHAGAESIVMTLWDVEDNASRRLITDFYRHLASGLSKDEALRQAKLDYLRNITHVRQGHPFFWAGYVVYGDTDPIIYPVLSFGRMKTALPWVIVALLLVISLAVWRRGFPDTRRRVMRWRSAYTPKALKRR